MSIDQLIKELKSLPDAQRWEVVDAILREDESWIPESFRKGMDDYLHGRMVPMEMALTEQPPLLE